MSADLSERAGVLLIRLGEAAVIIAVGFILIKIVVHIERKALERSPVDKSVFTFVKNATKVVLWIALFLMILQTLGVSTASLITILGASGAAVALALQGSLSNVAGGIITIIKQPFKAGDEIEIKGTVCISGIVDAVYLMNTELHTWDNKTVSVPNGLLTSSVLLHYTRSGLRRVDKTFSVAYGSDIDRVKDILKGVISEDPIFVKPPEPVIGVRGHGSSALLFDCKAWTRTGDFYNAGYRMEEDVKKAFDEAGVEIPYHQIDIHSR